MCFSGMPEAVIIEKRNEFSASLYDLLSAYAALRQKKAISNVSIEKRQVWSLKDAREMLMRMLGDLSDWAALDRFLIDYIVPPSQRTTALASSFAVSLELAREGIVEIKQLEPFAPIFMRGKPGGKQAASV
jgi:segregation and condensation protein A